MPAPGFTEYVLGDGTPPGEGKLISGQETVELPDGGTDGLMFVLGEGTDESVVGVAEEVKGGTDGP